MALLELQGIVAGYVEGIDILNGVHLGAARGTVTGVIGPNGAGKSTLLKTIFGFLSPRSGRIVLDGREVQGLAPHELKRAGIGYVPQGANIFPQLTVHENLELGAWVFRHNRARVASMLERAYDAFPSLREKRRLRATVLSGGEAKMLSVAKALVTEPSLLLGDEPLLRHPRHRLELARGLYRAVLAGAPHLRRNRRLHVGLARPVRRRADPRRHRRRSGRGGGDRLRPRHAMPPDARHLPGPRHLGVRRVRATLDHRRVWNHARRPRPAGAVPLRDPSSHTVLLPVPGARAGSDTCDPRAEGHQDH